MTIQKSLKDMTQRIANQFMDRVTSQLQKLDLDALLGTLGLQVARRPRSLMLPVVVAFGAGLAVGALTAPMSGKELRAKFTTLVGKRETIKPGIDGAPAESPYGQAARARRDDVSGNNGEKKAIRVADAVPHPS
jgi:hypothetical protein